MVSGPEPLHFDTFYRSGHIPITSYLNFSSRSREYGISHDLQRALSGWQGEWEPAQTVVRWRHLGIEGTGPLGGAPCHSLSVAPGSILIFDPKTTAHELRCGDGVLCYTWIVEEPTYRLEDMRR